MDHHHQIKQALQNKDENYFINTISDYSSINLPSEDSLFLAVLKRFNLDTVIQFIKANQENIFYIPYSNQSLLVSIIQSSTEEIDDFDKIKLIDFLYAMFKERFVNLEEIQRDEFVRECLAYNKILLLFHVMFTYNKQYIFENYLFLIMYFTYLEKLNLLEIIISSNNINELKNFYFSTGDLSKQNLSQYVTTSYAYLKAIYFEDGQEEKLIQALKSNTFNRYSNPTLHNREVEFYEKMSKTYLASDDNDNLDNYPAAGIGIHSSTLPTQLEFEKMFDIETLPTGDEIPASSSELIPTGSIKGTLSKNFNNQEAISALDHYFRKKNEVKEKE